MGHNFFRKIRVQIASYSLVAGVLSILLIGFILYYSLSNIVLKDAVNTTETAIGKSGNYIDSYIQRLKGLSLIIAKDPDVVDYFSEDGNPVLHQQYERNINLMIQNAMEADAHIKSIVLVSKDGKIISNEKSLNMTTSDDMLKESWYVAAIDNKKPVLTSARMQKFSMNKDEWVISLSREILDREDLNTGVLLIDIDYNVIEDYLDDLDLGNAGCAFIINDDGKAVYHKNTAYFSDPRLQKELQDFSKMDTGYDAKSHKLFQPYPIKNTDWTLVGVSSLDSLSNIKRQLIETVIVVSLILLAVLAFSGTFFAKRITNPINELEKAMENVEKGLMKVNITGMGCLEAESLALHFNKMAERIHILMSEIKDNEKYLREYELKVLHSQINPHFLYNTLDTIVWMAEFNDSDKVIAITKALAQFFRLSLSGGNELTTIENEFDHVRQYLFIQKERYGEKLSYNLEYNDQISKKKIPKIILQPMVENAIYHGIRGLDEGGEINVHAKIANEKIIFTIEDNGEGFDMNKKTDDETSEEVKLGGVGIKNVDKRIKLYYGENSGVKVVSRLGRGTTVSIIIDEKEM